MNRLYRFEFLLASQKPDLDIDALLMSEAMGYFFQDNHKMQVPVPGIIIEFEQMHQIRNFVFYRAVLAPKLWFLTQTYHNQVFLNKTVPEILSQVLEEGGLTRMDFEFKLFRDYNTPIEYVCQYNETHYNFFTRWLEREGMYFFFEPADHGEKIVITDSHLAHVPQDDPELVYSPPSGLDFSHSKEMVSSFNLRQSRVPTSVTLNDYNYRHPSISLLAQAEVSDQGAGQVYLYGEHYQTAEEGQHYAQVRAEGFQCRQKVWHGKSENINMIAGYTFTLKDHYRQDFNTEYLTISVKHKGSQAGLYDTGSGMESSRREKELYYRNSFTSIPKTVQFRPPRKSKKSRFFGSFNAHIDAAGSGRYAEVDEQGRYKVVLPFDLSGRGQGKASAWLRMVQPYVGSGHGMNFPLHKGVEVLLTFIDGNPDRPIISGAVPNPESPGIMGSNNQTRAGFQSKGGSRLLIEDQEGKERMVLKSGDGGTKISFGAGSASELTTITSNEFSCLQGCATKTIGYAQKIAAVRSHTTFTGWPWLHLFPKIIELGTDLVFEAVGGAGKTVSEAYKLHAPKDKKSAYSTTSKVAEVAPKVVHGAMGGVDFLVNLIGNFFLYKNKLKYFGEKAKYSGEPAIVLANMRKGNIFSIKSHLLWGLDNNKDIAIMTDTGDVNIFAEENLMTTAHSTILGTQKLQFSIQTVQEPSVPSTSPKVEFKAEDGKTSLRSDKYLSLSMGKGKLSGKEQDEKDQASVGIKIIAAGKDIRMLTETKGDILLGQEPKNEKGRTRIRSNAEILLEGTNGKEKEAGSFIQIKGSGETNIISSSSLLIGEQKSNPSRKIRVDSQSVDIKHDREVNINSPTVNFKGLKITETSMEYNKGKIKLG